MNNKINQNTNNIILKSLQKDILNKIYTEGFLSEYKNHIKFFISNDENNIFIHEKTNLTILDGDKNINIYVTNFLNNIFQYVFNIEDYNSIKTFLEYNHIDNISLNDIKAEYSEKKVNSIDYLKRIDLTQFSIFENTINELLDNNFYIGDSKLEHIQHAESEILYNIDEIIYNTLFETVGAKQ